MDAVNDPTVETLVVQSSAQIGKTEILQNIIAYYIDQDPGPMLLVQPTLEMAQAWSKDRLAPMLRDCPQLQGKVHDWKARDSAQTILHKTFPMGHLTMAGANSSASLASRPIRILLADEIDRFPVSAGSEGDPVNLASKRTTTFWNRKRILVSTPTIKGLSRIESAYEQSDRRTYHVPCPHCGHPQVLSWAQLKWEKDQPQTVRYECESCHTFLDEADKLGMIRDGQWVASAPFAGTAGFWISELYSPWVSWRHMVANFLAVKGNIEQFKVFVNTSWGETWEDKGDQIEHVGLMAQREDYRAPVPAEVLVLTAAVDVQDDRLEAEVIGWGPKEESWAIDYRRFIGSPGQPAVWNDLDDWLSMAWEHESGVGMKAQCVAIDMGGHHGKETLEFVRTRHSRRVVAVKGSNQPGSPLVRKSTTRLALYIVGTDTAKDTIFSRLALKEPGPGYCHFPRLDAYDDEYFRQLTAEERRHRKRGNQIVGHCYVKKKGAKRNEVLDLRVYNMAALSILNPNFQKIAQRRAAPSAQPATPTPPVSPDAPPPSPLLPPRPPRPKRTPSSNFVSRWRP
jgi:phage terminase large subunit GpA-like protein